MFSINTLLSYIISQNFFLSSLDTYLFCVIIKYGIL
nr:MAG TPA: hypothetical protein [Caudoviricetes sp.]